jgi:hypothetical protein
MVYVTTLLLGTPFFNLPDFRRVTQLLRAPALPALSWRRAVALLLGESSSVARVIRPFLEKIFLTTIHATCHHPRRIDLVLLRRLALPSFAG